MKRRSFWLKAVAGVALTAVVGAGAAVVALKTLFPEPKLRAWAVDTARRQLGRDVKLDRIGIGLGGLTLRGLEISESPDFSAGTFLSVETFRLRPSWRALVRRKLVVASIAADGMRVKVVKNGDGKFNYETLASSAASTASTTSASAKTDDAPPTELNVRRALVTSGSIEYLDKTNGTAWTVTDIDADVRDFGMAAPFGVTLSLRARGKAGARPVDAKIMFDGDVDLARGDRAAFKTDIRRLKVEAEGLIFSASGKSVGLDSPNISFDSTLSASGKTVVQAAGTAKLGDAVDVDVNAKTPGLDTRLIAKYLPSSGIPALDLPAAQLHLAAHGAGPSWDAKAFKLSWTGGEIEGAGTARGVGTPKPSYSGNARFGLNVPEIKPGEYPFLKLPPKLAVPAGRVDGSVALSGDVLSISSLNAKIKAGTVSINGSVRSVSSAKPIPDLVAVLALDVPSFRASDLPVAVSGIPPSLSVPAARLDGAVRVSGDDVRLDHLTIKSQGSTIRLNGSVAKALAGNPQPDVDVSADVNLPALTDKDLPFAGVPAGLQMPPSRWSADVTATTRLVTVKSLRLQTGKNDVAVSGTVNDPMGRGAFDLIVKCRSFVLDELTALTPQTRDLKLGGSGFFALSVTGVKEKPVYAGKLQFRGIGATVADLPLSNFAGTVSFDEHRVDVPNLTGKVADGNLKMDLTVKEYSRAPEIQLDADLDRFDLGRWLTAKAKVVSDHQAAQAAKAAQTGKPPAKTPPIATRGHFNVGTLVHPNATVNDVKISWDLRGITPGRESLTGDVQVQSGGGKFVKIGDTALKTNAVKVLVRFLATVRVLADYNDITLNGFGGDYLFKDGLMTVRRTVMDTDSTQITATGSVNLPAETQDLVVSVQRPPLDIDVTGGFADTKVKPHVGRMLINGAANGAKKILDLLQKPTED